MKSPALLLLFSFCLSVPMQAQEKGVNPTTPHSELATPHSTRAVVIGISDYQDSGIPDLRFADKDAEAFANFLRSPAGGGLDGDHLKILTNQQATMGKVAAALDWLLDVCREGDRAIIYFSGHGDVERKTISQPGYLLCWDAPPQVYMSGGAFNLRDLEEVVSTLSIQNKVRAIVIADACHAGKLSGAGIGGAQATAANLAKQYANEIKILSCQPNEYSIEGEQWGGGRGAFSFNLVDALYGMADGNGDLFVNLREVGRYLEDHVAAEVAPVSQNPKVVGDPNERLANVDAKLLAALRAGRTSQMQMLSPVEVRGMEDEVLAGADTTVRELYRLFKKAMQDKAFFEPSDACADLYYEKLIAEPKLERLHNTMRRNYAAALQDDAQQAVNNLMKMEKTEVRLYRLERLQKYAPYPRYLARAAELLGPNHYLYATLQGRKCYFEGNLLQMESPLNPDTVLGRQLLDKYRESLHWQPDAPLTYLDMSEVFVRILPNTDSVLWYGRKAMEVAPYFVRAYTKTAAKLFWPLKTMTDYGHYAQQFLDQAMALDSSQAIVWVTYGSWHYFKGDKDAAEPYFRKAAALDSSYAESYYWLGILSFDRGKMAEARRYFLKAAQSDKPNPNTFNYLGCTHSNAGEYDPAEKYFLQGLAIEPNHTQCLIHLAGVYFAAQRPGEADALLQKAMAYDSTSNTQASVGEVYLNNGFYPEAETALLKALSQDSTGGYTWVLLGKLYRATQRTEAAINALEKGVRLDSTYASDWSILAGLYLGADRKDDAERALKKALSINSSNVYNWLKLGGLYWATGRTAEAEQVYDDLLRQDSSIQTYLAMASNFLVNRRYEQADGIYQKTLQRDPVNAKACYGLACCRSLQNRPDEAFEYLERAFKNGWKDYDWAQKDTDLDSLRERPAQWKALMKKYFPDKVKD